MKLGIIGTGKMGGAIAKAALRSRIAVTVYDADRKKAAALARKGARLAKSTDELAKSSDVILVAVKPKDVGALLAGLNKAGACKGKLLISIAACVSTKFIARKLRGCRVVRVIPNMPVEVGAGASAFCLGKGARKSDAEFVEKLFGAVGVCEKVDEKDIDAAMVAGSCSPAFYALVINTIAGECARKGLERKVAFRLAAAACFGAGKMVLEGHDPQEIAKMVATPGGITAEGLQLLDEKGVWGIFGDAVAKACAKSRKVAKQFR